MDVMEMAMKVVNSLKGDKSLLTAFTGDPGKIVQSVLGMKLGDDILAKVIEAVKEQLGDLLGAGALKAAAGAAEDAAKSGVGGILGKIKDLF